MLVILRFLFLFTTAQILLVTAELPSKKSTLEKHRMLLSKVNEAKMSVKIEDILNSDDFQRACKNLIKVVYDHIALGKEENLPKTVPPCSQEEDALASCKQTAARAEADEQRIKDLIRRIGNSEKQKSKRKRANELSKQGEQRKKKSEPDFINDYLSQPEAIDALAQGDSSEIPASITVPAKRIVVNVKRAAKQAPKDENDVADTTVVESLLKRLKRRLDAEEDNSHRLVEITNGNSLSAPFSSEKERSIPKVKRTLLNDTARATPFLQGERDSGEVNEEEVQ